jgi:hypothetical protein
MMPDLLPIELRDMREECQRELDRRKWAYSDLVSHRGMNRGVANRRIDVMAAVVGLLDRLISEQEVDTQ